MTKLFVMIGLALACSCEVSGDLSRSVLILFGGMMIIAWAISEIED